ncbi:NADP-dependent malic enzyme [Limibacillus halophilus]|uniref:Malate dehydrogenase (Oxaloacetate-decarboxylating)(NADP+) n=1 Tax=Limibacillus halophilus TaxID=1579333 RepID=A0A839SR39_9PROT|nr:NADP-dependent malic enzyme [Limibacillus halophilus]MBB3064419.1 malate dehydrogenase (oxaloacetate-decarboxylating)(NADP+) [Limibacillus halophilus]
MAKDFREAALAYHRQYPPGKLEIKATKPLANQADLALAYSPGVAEACRLIVDDPDQVASVTARGNLIGVVTNGTAVLGLGAIGPLAAKPVMEGKAVLFKKFAGIDVFDIEVDERDPDRFVDIVAALEPTFGGINLEDIKAPECFEIEQRLRERMNIPVFHDDQHGTAIIVAAAIYNGLRLVGKKPEEVKLVTSGAGAAAIACLNLLVAIGVKRENIWVNDIMGLVYEGRTEQMDPWKGAYAQSSNMRSLDEVIEGADIFLGLSAPGVLTQSMVRKMADKPIIMALANPTPEIMPEEAKEASPGAIICSGRSDYPNQVNNVLCFPFIFKGALDVGATTINEEMKLACVKALADLAMAEPSEVVVRAYGETRSFGPEYLIPRPFDPRLLVEIAPAVAKAAMDSGVARRPIADLEAYKESLSQFVFRSGLVMKPVFDQARKDPKRVIYAEGEDERVLRAVQSAVDEGIARPILVGRPDVIHTRIERLGLRLQLDKDLEVINPESDSRYKDYWTSYHTLMERKGVTPDVARTIVRTRTSVIAALAVHKGDADAMICGVEGRFKKQVEHIRDVIGLADDAHCFAAMSLLILPRGIYFICDTYVAGDHNVQEFVEITLMAAAAVRRFGIEPKVAMISHSNFGAEPSETATKMRSAVALLHETHPELEVEGEMHADAALSESLRERMFPNSRLSGEANLLMMPTLDAANISFNLMKALGDGLPVGPILLGPRKPAHILTPSVTARGILNMTAVASVDAQAQLERRSSK